MTEKPVVLAFTDGACSGNPGPGGWGVLLRMGKHEKEIYGGEAKTTNQQMELQAAVEALKALKQPCKITVISDSKYVVQGMNEWIHNWKKKGWKTVGKKSVSNLDRWQELDRLAARHDVQWQWVKGHAGHVENERADELARRAIPA
ncbi:ribonuclease HI [Mariprofundus ferrooxydans]|uniref:ribonuclease HI n=1 Tax=Mariprofundus ferrooxydans TaxID=314344 RepID=UPI0014314190|nr:ribonuclease HI [Mariprofundus ferrooxydans]